MVNPEIEELFRDDESFYREALKDFEAKRIRKAAENAWAVSVRATEALLVAKGREYEKIRWTRERRYGLDALSVEDKAVGVVYTREIWKQENISPWLLLLRRRL